MKMNVCRQNGNKNNSIEKSQSPRGGRHCENGTGDVIFVKKAHEITAKVVKKIGLHSPPSAYERLGPNEMFGNKVQLNGKNVLKMNYCVMPKPVKFMNSKGYVQAEKVNVKEHQSTQGGSFGPEENIKHTFNSINQVGNTKLTYALSEDLNAKTNKEENIQYAPFVMMWDVSYTLVKPKGQDITATVELPENKSDAEEAEKTEKGIEVIKTVQDAKESEKEASSAWKAIKKAARLRIFK